MNTVSTKIGQRPIILAQPHCGLHIPDEIYKNLNKTGKKLADTDWFIDLLYNDLLDDVTTIKANFHRYVIDPNRAPEDVSLYPGQNTTGLCPLTDFTGNSIYVAGLEPDADEIQRRVQSFHQPYHIQIQHHIDRLLSKYNEIILYDCHSIYQQIPYLFDGILPDLNIGTNSGLSCSPLIESIALQSCQQYPQYSVALNGRFKGGWTTRYYGNNPRVQAIQMELSQATYMQKDKSLRLCESNAQSVKKTLSSLLTALEGGLN